MANRKAPRLNEAKFSYTDAPAILDAEVIEAGKIVFLDTSTLEVSQVATSGQVILGVATEEVDNTADGETCNFISTAIHGMDKIGAITQANIGDTAYISDAETVSVSGPADSFDVAGIIVNVDADYAYVDFDPAK